MCSAWHPTSDKFKDFIRIEFENLQCSQGPTLHWRLHIQSSTIFISTAKKWRKSFFPYASLKSIPYLPDQRTLANQLNPTWFLRVYSFVCLSIYLSHCRLTAIVQRVPSDIIIRINGKHWNAFIACMRYSCTALVHTYIYSKCTKSIFLKSYTHQAFKYWKFIKCQ